MILPQFHSQRFGLNDEVHARPSQAIQSPARVSYLVLTSPWPNRDQDLEPVRDLAQRHGIAPPDQGANFFVGHLGPCHVKWERHTEFTRYTFFAEGGMSVDMNSGQTDPFGDPAIGLIDADWVAALPGELITAVHGAIVRRTRGTPDFDAIAQEVFGGHMLVGASVAGGGGSAMTDFRIHGDGFSRILIEDRRMTRWQTGRVLQRLLDLETYRMMALLALPVARELAPVLAQQERELEQITTSMTGGADVDDPMLLDRLTRLQAAIENRQSQAHYRFSAARAYYDLVRQRIQELREERIEGLQTFEEFTVRRLAPAMNTCTATATRQDSLSARVARTTQLLSTRVDIAREKQNQELLASMDRRAALQLRLQETVEGLSVAAITYYVVGLIGYAAKALAGLGVALKPALVQGIAIPFVILVVALGVRSIRKAVSVPDARPWKFW